MTDTDQDEVYTGATIEEDIRKEARQLGWELVVACLDGVLAILVALMLIWIYEGPMTKWIDALGKIIVGIGHISLLLPLLSVTMVIFAISRLYTAVHLWRDRRMLLS